MEIGANKYRKSGLQWFTTWRDENLTIYQIFLAFLFACLTGLGSFFRLYTPFTPVPFTLQVFFVLMSGYILGSRYGALSQTMYMFLGIIGIPWFAGGNCGLNYALGATGGYLLGFILASTLIGWNINRYDIQSRTDRTTILSMFLGLTIIYLFGVSWLTVVMQIELINAIFLGVLPFMVFDFVKIFMASYIGKIIIRIS